MADDFGHEPAVRVPIRLRPVVDADDLKQSAMLRFYRRGGEFQRRSESELQAYLRRSFASALGDALRRDGRARRSGNRVALALEEIAADTSTPSRKAIRNERQASLAEVLAALPDDQRRAVALHHFQGRTLAETAAAMGRTAPSVAGLIRRAFATLRRDLAEHGEL